MTLGKTSDTHESMRQETVNGGKKKKAKKVKPVSGGITVGGKGPGYTKHVHHYEREVEKFERVPIRRNQYRHVKDDQVMNEGEVSIGSHRMKENDPSTRCCDHIYSLTIGFGSTSKPKRCADGKPQISRNVICFGPFTKQIVSHFTKQGGAIPGFNCKIEKIDGELFSVKCYLGDISQISKFFARCAVNAGILLGQVGVEYKNAIEHILHTSDNLSILDVEISKYQEKISKSSL